MSCAVVIAVERSELRTSGPKLFQSQQNGCQIAVHQHARGDRSLQAGTRRLLHRAVDVRTWRGGRLPATCLHRVDRRQRQMCIRDRSWKFTTRSFPWPYPQPFLVLLRN